jgi:hypothetical protein
MDSVTGRIEVLGGLQVPSDCGVWFTRIAFEVNAIPLA